MAGLPGILLAIIFVFLFVTITAMAIHADRDMKRIQAGGGFTKRELRKMSSYDKARYKFKSSVELHHEKNSPVAQKLLNEFYKKLNAFHTQLKEKKSKQDLKLFEVEFSLILESLSEIYSKDYYLSVLQNPAQWDNSEERIEEANLTLMRVSKMLDEKIKTINQSLDGDASSRLRFINSLALSYDGYINNFKIDKH